MKASAGRKNNRKKKRKGKRKEKGKREETKALTLSFEGFYKNSQCYKLEIKEEQGREFKDFSREVSKKLCYFVLMLN